MLKTDVGARFVGSEVTHLCLVILHQGNNVTDLVVERVVFVTGYFLVQCLEVLVDGIKAITA